MKTFLLTFEHGPNYKSEKSFHDQQNWENHSRFADKLFLQHKVTMCGALKNESKVIAIANGKNESSIRNLFKDDPFLKNGVLILTHVDEWELYLNPEHVDE
ncbi:MAG: hypothetical protein PHY57_03985 [Ignavibacterium sp.]|jgi:uncharacterized protein YciI|nr:hypothetical protein [Ignavibacterium sp.]MDX9711321.1 hypothetical protein [Ignavibacteriaceae bacterium]MEB2354199.1 hypothetical protein [Ignavibacteriales bacterium]GIK20709.1 MAG: hypothetical protein BroJett005_01230 [Ignavibacteriota bacterium]